VCEGGALGCKPGSKVQAGRNGQKASWRARYRKGQERGMQAFNNDK